MIKTLIVVLTMATVILRAEAADVQWLTDVPKAEAQAKLENKVVLLDFTGSDWCEACARLKKEIFDTEAFESYAAKNLVLVEVDFPDKKQQSKELKKTNAALQDQYGVEGFPTLIVLDQNGKEIGRQAGYDKGGPKVLIDQLEKFKAGK